MGDARLVEHMNVACYEDGSNCIRKRTTLTRPSRADCRTGNSTWKTDFAEAPCICV